MAGVYYSRGKRSKVKTLPLFFPHVKTDVTPDFVDWEALPIGKLGRVNGGKLWRRSRVG